MAPKVRGLCRSAGAAPACADVCSKAVWGSGRINWLNSRLLVSPEADIDAAPNDPPPLLPKGDGGGPSVTPIVTGAVCAETLSGASTRPVQKTQRAHSLLSCRGQRCRKRLQWRRGDSGPDMHDPP